MANYTKSLSSINFTADAELLHSSGKLRFGKYLRNAGSMGWVLTWRSYITLAKTFTVYMTATVLTRTVLASDVFGNGIPISLTSIAITQTLASHYSSRASFNLRLDSTNL
jgi:uncharacterized membrane protein (DUF485 family)